MKLNRDNPENPSAWLRRQILRNARVIKYGIVGCAGIVINLGTMALFVTVFLQRGWIPAAVANIVSTVGNFVLHNVWTFSDRQHRGLRMVRGFLSFALMSAIGICLSTVSYVGLVRFAARLPVAHFHPGGLGIVLGCQFIAILVGASVSYGLNREFTWPGALENVPSNTKQAQEI
ncbi:MAG: GtrA family protein [Candidatus Acidiferrales bacterium]